MEVLIKGPDSGASAEEVADRAREVDGVAMAFAPDNAQWRTDGAAVVGVIPTEETVDSTKAHVVEDVMAADRRRARESSGSPAWGRPSSTTSTRSTRSSRSASG